MFMFSFRPANGGVGDKHITGSLSWETWAIPLSISSILKLSQNETVQGFCREFHGLWEFLGFLENARNPKYPHLQASVEKHAIIHYIYSKNLYMDLFDG